MKRILKIFIVFSLITVILFGQSTISFAKDSDKSNSEKQESKSNKEKDHEEDEKYEGKDDDKNKKSHPTPTAVSNDYKFEVINLLLPTTLKTHEEIKTSITLKNNSNTIWKKDEVKLTYHWIDQNGQFEIYKSETTSLKKDVLPNETFQQNLEIESPKIAGNFTFAFDLIKENKFFSQQSNSKYLRQITITGFTKVNDLPSQMSINDGAELANNPKVSIEITPFLDQQKEKDDDENLIYDFVQATDSTPFPPQNSLY